MLADRRRADCPSLAALLVASRNWQLESLYRSNAKYQPEWQPRYICFEYTSDLPLRRHGRWWRRRFPDTAVVGDVEPARQGTGRGCSGAGRRGMVAEVTAAISRRTHALAGGDSLGRATRADPGTPREAGTPARAGRRSVSSGFSTNPYSRRSGKRRVKTPPDTRTVVRFRSPAASSLVGMAASSASLLCATEPATCKS